jgi:hypothetical protein
MSAPPHRRHALNLAITEALCAGKLSVAADRAREHASRARASLWYPCESAVGVPELVSPAPVLTRGKLQHDLEQLQYLDALNLLPRDLKRMPALYSRMLASPDVPGRPIHSSLTDTESRLVADVYGRLVYMRNSPRVRASLSQTWDGAEIEERYGQSGDIVVVDDFLSADALSEVRRFCLESTVWFTNRYAHDRLGAFFRDGFNCPLLIQIAEELGKALPQLIGERFPLRQLWAFKYDYRQPQLLAHADFAAVNVNIWITPDDANLDSKTGGMILYDLKAPRDWDFDAYNKHGHQIDAFMREKRPRAINIPYRANRAIIFNSDLFHTTAPICFRPGYENRRINITLLFGAREQYLPMHNTREHAAEAKLLS